MVAPASWVSQLDEWAGPQPKIPSRSAAIRALVDAALAMTKKGRGEMSWKHLEPKQVDGIWHVNAEGKIHCFKTEAEAYEWIDLVYFGDCIEARNLPARLAKF